MEKVSVAGIDLAYTRHGKGDPVMLISGLGGQGRGWARVIGLFAGGFDTIVPDHPGTGESSQPDEFTLVHHTEAMAELIRHLDLGPTHVIGSSTGGAIAMLMALDHPDTVRSISLVSSWARADDFFRHQFAVRKDTLLREGVDTYVELTALFLFSPAFFRDHYDQVRAWCDVSGTAAPETMARRIDMIIAHDVFDRLGEIAMPTLVVVGDQDVCTPPYFSHELAEAIPRAELEVMHGGHLIYKEKPEEFHRTVKKFLDRHAGIENTT